MASLAAGAQEFRANVSVQAAQLGTNVEKRIFTTMQTALNEFINGRRWTDDAFTPAERIEANFMVNVTQDLGNNTYRATLTVQAGRPVFNTSYTSSIFNTQDNNLVFRYVEFQPMEFNEQRISGNDPLASNLTAVVAYYCYIILGLDYDSFSPRGGDSYYKKPLIL